MLFIVVIVFVALHLPFTALIFIRNKLLKNSVMNQIEGSFQILWYTSHYLLYLNAAVNPIIYGLTNDNFRRAYHQTPILPCRYKTWWNKIDHMQSKYVCILLLSCKTRQKLCLFFFFLQFPFQKADQCIKQHIFDSLDKYKQTGLVDLHYLHVKNIIVKKNNSFLFFLITVDRNRISKSTKSTPLQTNNQRLDLKEKF